ncbi:hypothetical protein NA57DRAFT_75203 [Rhizodiscina lignyota]|uniref:Uncharacterized protein n=1 Tax=Rhizodiscina lignyota TaxID=1504668 RepID=A0A9P4II26_9PEZI|nr:hypothetical protein NA57DRAFT_75203 [Rhizodiscina lignyota]
MQALRRGTQASVRTSRSLLRSQQRRFESHDSGHAQPHASHGSSDSNESLGRGFYIGVTCIPLIFLIHDFATSKDPWVTRMISYDWSEEWARRNNIHLEAVQRAAADRNLFLNSEPSQRHELRSPEQFNSGSAHNVWAGAYINLDKVIAHYENQNREEEEAKLGRLQQQEKGSK